MWFSPLDSLIPSDLEGFFIFWIQHQGLIQLFAVENLTSTTLSEQYISQKYWGTQILYTKLKKLKISLKSR